MNHGARNLLLLGFLSIAIAAFTTIISVAIYHNSGDIYLDRSRPGFLPEEPEESSPADAKYIFSDNGPITPDILQDYAQHLEAEQRSLDALKEPFSPDPLSDASLGIPSAESE